MKKMQILAVAVVVQIAAGIADQAHAQVELAPPPGLVLVRELNSLPYRSVICHQSGKAILEQGNLDLVRLYTDTAGILRRIDFKRSVYDLQTITVSPDTSCQVF